MTNKKYYSHIKEGDTVEVKIRDQNYRILYKNRFNIGDRRAIMKLLGVLEKFSGFSITEIIREKLKLGEWI